MALIANQMAPGPQPQASPQSGNVVQRIVTAAIMLLNTDQVEQHVLQIIKGAQDPAQGLAQSLAFLMQTLSDKSKGMPMQALGQAMMPILQQIAKMAEAAKILQPTPQLLQQAGKAALQLLQQSAAPQAAPAPQQPAPQAAPAQPPVAPQGV